MAGRRGQQANDLVTIIYPPGCREISEDLGSDELIRRLKTLAHTFQTLGQAEDESTYSDYTPLAIHLVEEYYLNNPSRDVQLLVACCVADILRIFAPEAPYKTAEQIKTIFYFLIKQLGGLRDPKDPAFKRYFYLLENLAYVKSFNMCLDLEDCNEIFCSLFSLMFKIVNDEHSGKVKTFMLDVLCPLITEADFISNDLLDLILINIVEPNKSSKKNAASLAQDLISKTSDTLEPYIQQFFNQALILGKADTKLAISRKVYDLIYELNLIAPRLLLAVMPQLEFKLKSTEESERMGSVSLLARMFSERGSDLAKKHKQLWNAFLGRYNDISVAIRIKCVQYTMHFLLNHPELHSDITEILKARQHDAEEAVRFEVVTAIVSTARKDFDLVAKNESLLENVKERTLDKKFKIRKEALTGLALIYKKHLNDPMAVPEATKVAVTWIKDKILHAYYMTGLEDRLLVERLMNTCLVPFNLETNDRMKKLLLLFTTIGENACKAFIEMQKNQKQVRKCLTDYLAVHKQPRTDKNIKELHQKMVALSRCLPEAVKSQEFLKKLSNNLYSDANLLSLFERIVDADVSCKECSVAGEQILKKLGPPIMTNLYFNTVKQILERASSVMIDREAIQHLTALVKEAMNEGPVLMDLGIDVEVATERGLRLLLVLAFVYPSHFIYTDIMKELISLMALPRENIGPLVLSIFTFIGRQQPIAEVFSELLDQLVPICKTFIRSGTVKQAKHAVKCLFVNTTDTQDAIFADVLEQVKEALTPDRGELYCTAIVALGHIAFLLPDKYPVHIKNIVSRKIVKELIMKDNAEARADNGEWEEPDDLPLETRCKIEGMKMMARWLTGLKSDTISAQKTFRMLNAFILCKGDLLEEGKPNQSERAALRLAAGCAMLKICETKDVGDVYTMEQFYNLATLATDPCKQVRKSFILKLHKGLIRGVPLKCLPLDFMGIFALVGLEEDKRIREMTRQLIAVNIAKRRDCIKTLNSAGGEQVAEQLCNVMPDYMLIFGIAVLAHHPEFDNYEDVAMLKRMKAAIWFILEPLMTKNEAYSFGFYKALVEKVKNHRDAVLPDNDSLNKRIWALCDLALGLLMTKSSTYELKEFPAEPVISPMFFVPHEDPNFLNMCSYLPQELVVQPPKKLGISIQYLPSSSATAKKKKNETRLVVTEEDVEDEEEAAGVDGENNEDSETIIVDMTSNQQEQQDEDGEGSGQRRAGRKRGRPAAATDIEAEPPKKSAPASDQQDTSVRRARGRPAKVKQENGSD